MKFITTALLSIFVCLVFLEGCGKEPIEEEFEGEKLDIAQSEQEKASARDGILALDTEEKIYDYAKELIDREITVKINDQETTISIGYEGRHTQDVINQAFSAIKNGLKETAYKDYYLSIGGMDGQPLQYDPKPLVESLIVKVPETIPYKHVGCFAHSPAPLFEIVSNESQHEHDASLALNTIKSSMGSSDFYFYIVDENEKFLGCGSKNEYTPYVFSTIEPTSGKPPYAIPFTYYMSKYLSKIGYESYSYKSYRNTERGYKQYEFTINLKSTKDCNVVKAAIKDILEAMEATLENQPVTVTIIAYPRTEQEIRMRTYDPDKDGDDANKALGWLKSKTK